MARTESAIGSSYQRGARGSFDRMHAVHQVGARFKGGLSGIDDEPVTLFEPPQGYSKDSVVLTFNVAAEHAGTRLDRFIQNRIPRLSRTRAQKIIRACACRRDGTKRLPSDLVRAGETVLLVRERFIEPDTPLDFDIVFQDEAVLAIDKPAGLPVHPSATYHKHTLSYLLKQRYESGGSRGPRIAHRLDRETSGIVICGCTKGDETRLKRAFEEHRVQKTYLAIVRGHLAEAQGSIAIPMMRIEEGLHLLMKVCDPPRGLEARTDYKVVERRSAHSLVELFPRTGRQHQLRVHMSAIGHPIVGDKLYGPEGEAPFMEYIDTGLTDQLVTRLGHWRHALHAHHIVFEHPRTGEPMALESPLPRDLVELWKRL
jgi:23S rRNA pseudouridine1911/1915/1917 synthase